MGLIETNDKKEDMLMKSKFQIPPLIPQNNQKTKKVINDFDAFRERKNSNNQKT